MNDPVGPGDSVFVAGSDLASASSVKIWRVSSDQSAAAAERSAESASILSADLRSLTFAIPPTLASGIYGFTVQTPEGEARGTLNAPSVYWNQANEGRSATPGGWIRVIGRNIARTDGAKLQLRRDGATMATIQPSKSDLWDASFPVPTGLESGRYDLLLNNGDGGGRIWQAAGSISIAASTRSARDSVQNIRDFGAIADGTTDASVAIDQALAAVAAAGGGVVEIPQGRYLVTRTLQIPDNVTLKGVSMDRTLLLLDDSDSPPNPLIQGERKFSVEDLSIVAKRHMTLIEGGMRDGNPIEDAEDIRIERVRIRASAFMGHLKPEEVGERLAQMLKGPGIAAILLSGNNVSIIDCDIRSSTRSIFLNSASDAVVAGNLIGNGRRGWYSISGSRRVLFEDNSIYGADLQSTGGSLNTLRGNRPASEDILVRNNQFSSMFGGDREALTTDGPGGFFYGSVSMATPSSIVMRGDARASNTDFWPGAAFYVVGGAGLGQYARVSSVDGDTVTLDRPLSVTLDDTSNVSIVPALEDFVVVDNRFEDTGALQVYGTGMNNVFAGNHMIRSIGIRISGGEYPYPQPCWFTQVLDNTIESANGFVPTHLRVAAWSQVKSDQERVLTYGTVVRDNTLGPLVQLEVSATRRLFPLVGGTIVERNTLADGVGAIKLAATGGKVMSRANVAGGPE